MAAPRDCVAQAVAVGESLRTRVESAPTDSPASAAGAGLLAHRALRSFYSGRDYRPAWSEDGRVGTAVGELVEIIADIDTHGLTPGDYHLDPLSRALEQASAGASTATLIDLDLLASDAYLLLASHLLSGKVNPQTLDPEWIANRREGNMAERLNVALERGDIGGSLEALAPRSARYHRLRAALAGYRSLAAASRWPAVPAGRDLERGDSGARVAALRARLAVEPGMDGRSQTTLAESFDDDLASRVMAFQRHYGLEPDGVVGPRTLAALNLGPQHRANQIMLNLERWRWLPEDLGARRIEVNVAEAELAVFDGERTVLTMRVVVGRPYRRTPVFSAALGHLVLSPFWEIPTSIAVNDLLPKVQRTPDYLAGEGIRVLSGWGADAAVLDPAKIDWRALGPGRFPYRLRQDPGPKNALGEVKFMFPNAFDVYLHDTNRRDLFAKAERTASSGCIRVQRARELTLYLLRNDDSWTSERIQAVVDGGEPTTVRLPEKLPVHLLYFTAWSDLDGSVRFREDVYGRDALLAAAMAQRPQ